MNKNFGQFVKKFLDSIFDFRSYGSVHLAHFNFKKEFFSKIVKETLCNKSEIARKFSVICEIF